MTHRLLLIWTARRIPTCQYHLDTLTGIDKLWIYGHTEYELSQAIPTFLAEHPQYTTIGIAPDDGIYSQQTIDAVFNHADELGTPVSGWSNCDYTHHYTNIGNPDYNQGPPSTAADYNLLSIPDVAAQPEPFQAGFAGHSLLTMHRTLWLDPATSLEPIQRCAPGSQSDYNQCRKLWQAGIPITIHPNAHIAHLKLNHLETDTTGWKTLDLTRKAIQLEACHRP